MARPFVVSAIVTRAAAKLAVSAVDRRGVRPGALRQLRARFVRCPHGRDPRHRPLHHGLVGRTRRHRGRRRGAVARCRRSALARCRARRPGRNAGDDAVAPVPAGRTAHRAHGVAAHPTRRAPRHALQRSLRGACTPIVLTIYDLIVYLDPSMARSRAAGAYYRAGCRRGDAPRVSVVVALSPFTARRDRRPLRRGRGSAARGRGWSRSRVLEAGCGVCRRHDAHSLLAAT